ncbi:MAG: hypothetical protein LDL33_07880 [Desulfomonile sp.]|nr:hypothetical protein [Desulfomonile sp.]
MKIKLLLFLAAALLLLAVPVSDGTLYELESCIRDCRNRYDPTFNTGGFRDCIEQCIRKYVPPEYL